MNANRARELLELNVDFSEQELKKQYRRKALLYHPDKNHEPDAAEKFREIHDAYQYLATHGDLGMDFDSDSTDYESVLMRFLKTLWGQEDDKSRLFYMIVHKIANCCEARALTILEKMDKNVLIKIHGIFDAYREVFHFSEGFLKTVEKVLNEKMKRDECIILNPFVDDLFDHNLYKLVENGETFLVPLWHHELVYEVGGSDLYVKCEPVLPENMRIDSKNNIHVELEYTIQELLYREEIDVFIGKRVFRFSSSDLKICKSQTFILYGQGFSRINTKDIYDISRLGDVVLHIELH